MQFFFRKVNVIIPNSSLKKSKRRISLELYKVDPIRKLSSILEPSM